ncbi:MAG: hypothetical protein QOE77_1771 [Blastocatellia bacterium]|nr:hypothetical protein [Blastocatellia bacterium]
MPEVTPDHLLAMFDRTDYEKNPYVMLLTIMGSEMDVEPFIIASDDIWHFDTECIEDHNDYVRIAQRLADLAGGELPLDDLKDYVDVDGGVAWLSFTLNGQRVRWDAKVDADWVDATILSRIAELLRSRGPGRQFTYYDLGGQDCLLGCATPENLQRLRAATSMDFVWLT